jgi:hypothetical protein
MVGADADAVCGPSSERMASDVREPAGLSAIKFDSVSDRGLLVIL